jgi:hypothetical protein
MKGGFNNPLLPSFTPGEKQYEDQIRWRLEFATIPLVTELGALAFFTQLISSSK